MKNSKIISTLAFFAVISCTNNKTHDDHGHDHGPNGEHLDESAHDHGDASHQHNESHDQETFEIIPDSLAADTLKAKVKKDSEPHSHEHSGENGHSH